MTDGPEPWSEFRLVTLRCGHKEEAPAALEIGDWWNCLACSEPHPITARADYVRRGPVPKPIHGRRTKGPR
jgi:hypothetical protein